MGISRNLLAGVLGSFLTALVGLAVVPLYLSHLGIEAYGLIGFFATIQAILQLLDMGITPTVNREVARCIASNAMPQARTLLRTLELINWTTATLIAIVVGVLSHLIAKHWLQSQTLSASTLANSVALMALVLAFRWPVALYQAALIGMHRLDLSSGLSTAAAIIGSVGAVCVLHWVSPTLEAYFLWQIGVSIAYTMVVRRVAWKHLGRDARVKFNVGSLQRVWRFSAGLSGIAVSALVLTQLDKVLLSKLLTLPEFGQYMLATTIAGGFSVVLFMPTFNIVYPVFSALIAKGDMAALDRTYRTGTRLMVTFLFPMALFVWLLSNDLLRLWTGNPEIAASVAPLLKLLAIGAALHGVMYFPYALQLASGSTALPLRINALLLVVMVPLIMYLVPTYGAQGGALAWVLLNAFYVPVGAWLTHRIHLKGVALRWLFVDIGIPAVLAVVIGALGHAGLSSTSDNPSLRVALGAACALTLFTLSLSASPSILIEIRHRVRRFRPTVANQ